MVVSSQGFLIEVMGATQSISAYDFENKFVKCFKLHL